MSTPKPFGPAARRLLAGESASAPITTPEEIEISSVAYDRLAGDFADLVGGSTEAPREYLLAVFLAIIGVLVGRRAWLVYSRATYANLYVLLLGATGDTRKSTAIGFGLDLLREVSLVLSLLVKPLYGLASIEGLACSMRDPKKEETYQVIAVEDEFRSLVTKGQQKGVLNLIPRLTELYNCGDRFEVNTKNDRISIENPFLSIISASTPSWFENSVTASDVSGGFLNRWDLFGGRPGAAIAFPKGPPPDPWRELIGRVARCVQAAQGEFVLSPGAEACFTKFYSAFRKRTVDDFAAEATSRIPLHAVKYGLIYAITAERPRRIEEEDMTRGIAVADYNRRIAETVFGNVAVSRLGSQEKRLLAFLNSGRQATREILRTLRISAEELDRIIRPLERMGEVKCIREQTQAGRTRVYVELA